MTQQLDATLSKGLTVLELLAHSPRSMGISEIAAELRLNKSNVYRLANTLRAMGYVLQEPDRRYRCSLKVWKLGTNMMKHIDLAGLAAPAMHHLAHVSGETVHLSVLDGLKALYIDKIDSQQPVRTYSERGGNAPLHCVAIGKVLLAYHYDDLRERIEDELEPFTARTITTLEELDREVARIVQSGLALNIGEFRDDVAGMAAPVFDPAGRIMASIGISGPLARFTKRKIKEHRPAVIEAGKRISHAINMGQAVK